SIQVAHHPDRAFLSSKEVSKGTKIWKHYSFAEVQEYADRVSQLLLDIGLQKDDKIALIASNCPEWNFIDLGALQIGVVVVPMYPNISQKDYEYIFNDAGI